MTNIEFFKAVAENVITDEVIAKAQELVEKDAADKEKLKAKRAEKAGANSALDKELCELVADICGTEPISRGVIFDELVATGHDMYGDKPLTPARVTRICGMLIEQGKLAKSEIKTNVLGADGKSKTRKQVGYCVA